MRKKKWGLFVLFVLLLSLVFSMSAFAAKKDGWYQKGNGWYYSQDGQNRTGWMKLGNARYYLQKEKNGRMALGWLKSGNKWYYLEESKSPLGSMRRGWLTLGDKKYYLSKKNGVMYTGKKKIGKNTYLFADSGELYKKLTKPCWKSNSTGKWYDNGDGTYPKSKFQKIDGKTYYFDSKGYVLTGWQKVNSNIYYLGKDGVMAVNTWVATGGKRYFVGKNGVMAISRWVGKRYVGPDGFWIKKYQSNVSKDGWSGNHTTVRVSTNNTAAVNWRYFKNGKPLKGLRYINNKYYYFESDGYLRIGWLDRGGYRYFMNTLKNKNIGVMVTGWMKIDGSSHYFFPSGKMARNQTLLASDNKYYTFGEDGKLTKVTPK